MAQNPVKSDGIGFCGRIFEIVPAGVKIGVFDRRGDIDLGAPAANQPSEGLLGQTCSAVDDDRCSKGFFQLSDKIKIDLRPSFVDAMGSPDCRRKGVNSGLSDKSNGILQAGQGCILRRNLQGIFDPDDPSEFSLDLYALAVGILHNLPAPGDILFHRETGSVIHNRIPSCVNTGLSKFYVLAMIKMDEHID